MTNKAAIGFMINAALQAEFNFETIELLVRMMIENMDLYTEVEAEQAYTEFTEF